MSFLQMFIKVSAVLACGATSFLGVQAYVAAKPAVASHHAIANGDLIAIKIAESVVVGSTHSMSPIYPTIKYTRAQLSVSPARKNTKSPARQIAKMKAVRSAVGKPLQIAYAGGVTVAAHDDAGLARIR